MIWITGDTHGDPLRFRTDSFPEQKEMTRADTVIVCGDFGCVWQDSKEERAKLKWLSEKPFTLVFVDGNHECMHRDTEVLTSDGWVNIVSVFGDIHKYKVASVDLNGGNLSFDMPLGRTKKYAEHLIDFNGKNYRQCVTENHDIVIRGSKVKASDASKMDLRESDLKFHVKTPNVGIDLSDDMIRLLTFVVMDGTVVDYKKYCPNSEKVRVQFHLKKQRKIDYLCDLLYRMNIPFTFTTTPRNTSVIRIYSDSAKMIYNKLGRKKEIPHDWCGMNASQFVVFLSVLCETDAQDVDGRCIWRTTSEHNVGVVSELCVRLNYDMCVTTLKDASGYKKGQTQYHIGIKHNKQLDNMKVKICQVPYMDYAYCLSTKYGTLITRYKGKTCITGNCFDRLYSEFDTVEFHGAKAHRIRENVFHICRGEVMTLEGKTFWCFGGAQSHDISDGIVDPADYASRSAMKSHIRLMEAAGKYMFRVKGVSWWPEEMPDEEEKKHGLETLAGYGNRVNYIVTHCCPAFLAAVFSAGRFEPDPLTEYFNEVSDTTDFDGWFFGHYHRNWSYDKYEMLYERMVRVI